LAEREARWRFSAIFDKVGSSGIVKVLHADIVQWQNTTFVINRSKWYIKNSFIL